MAGDNGPNHDITDGEIFPVQMHKILEHREGNTVGHIHYRPSG